jgi:hypothetical protein
VPSGGGGGGGGRKIPQFSNRVRANLLAVGFDVARTGVASVGFIGTQLVLCVFVSDASQDFRPLGRAL